MHSNGHTAASRLLPAYLAASATAATGMVAAITISTIAAERMLGSATWTGLPMAASILGTAFGSHLAGRRLERTALRTVLASQYAIGLVGGALALLAIAQQQVALLAFGLAGLGLGHGATQYARYLAADVVAPQRKAQALSWVVWTGGLGAVIGPSLLAPTGRWASSMGLPEVAGPYCAAMVAFAACALCYLAVIPRTAFANPAESEAEAATNGTEAAVGGRSSGIAAWSTAAKLAVFAMVTGHVTMVFVMTMTPIHLTHGGHGLGAIGVVISAHMAGMYLCAPLVGWLCGRLGPLFVMVSGGVLLAIAALLAALVSTAAAGATASAMPFEGLATIPMTVPLFLLGLGWNCGFVAGSTLLNSALEPQQRLRGRGLADACVWTAAATSSLTSSLLFARIGFAQLSWVAFGLSVILVTVLVIARASIQTVGSERSSA